MTNKTKPQAHTPGPWTIHDDGWLDHEGRTWVVGPDEHRIADVGAEYEGVCKANALLIAASPTMYDFIKRQAEEPCHELPGEYPEAGESGKAPCLACEAKELLTKAGLL